MKILVCIPHFFGSNSYFSGGSSHEAVSKRQLDQRILFRQKCIERTIQSAEKLGEFGADVHVRVCAVDHQHSLVAPDWQFSSLPKPTLLVYEVLERLAAEGVKYDYSICLEDDIILPTETFKNVLEFDKQSLANELLHPNRIEVLPDGSSHCVDLSALEGWCHNQKYIFDRVFAQAMNPHSAIAIFSEEKLRYALRSFDPNDRERTVGGPMASAFANIHRPFVLWRPRYDLRFHTVIHQDQWVDPKSRWSQRLYKKAKKVFGHAPQSDD